jgi:uncharacterized protein (UPF0335 family)
MKKKTSEVAGISGEHLEHYISRIERLESEKADLTRDIRDVYLEAKVNGFDPKIMRQVVRLRKMSKEELDEQETMLELYRQAVGMA